MNIKRFISIFLVFVLSLGMSSVAIAEGNSEIPEGYTPVYTAEDLNNIRNNLSGKYILMNDIDLSIYENWEPIGTTASPFTGEFDGGSMIIKNLTISEECTQDGFYNLGLFGYCQNSMINNVCVINADIEAFCLNAETAKCRVGIIVGFGQSVTVTNCVVEGTVTAKGFYATEAGGIAGRTHSLSNIINCVNHSDISITATASATKIYVGGVAGVASGRIEECCNFGEIYVESDTADLNCEVKSGGINGSGAEMGLVSNCYNRGNLIIDFAMSKTYVGGISGDSFIIDNSYNTGKISVPENFEGYAGAISGNIGIGGVYADIYPYVENVYFLETELTIAYAGKTHPDDYNEEEFECVYKSFAELSDSEMRNQSSFTGFDFETVWSMEENGYPVLQNQPNLPETIPEDPPTEPTNNNCHLTNLWLFREISWLLNLIEEIFILLVHLVYYI